MEKDKQRAHLEFLETMKFEQRGGAHEQAKVIILCFPLLYCFEYKIRLS